ncbi:MAG: ZIP family metal transporter [Candidatus Omnitrophica bacterium]|jgi:ZIP family zinc transporter|nr:ZIP family metal transporter [Candidatus Omnitrophota bacterium]MDD5080090.1 ZIP family metal transporter [Candidatus Omnitrophota bacterium]
MNLILIGTLASLIAGAATLIGALAVFFMHRVSDKFLDMSLGFSAGVMLAATFFGLVAPAIKMGGTLKTAVGILLGALFLILMEKTVPHVHRVAGVKGPPTHLSKTALFILAITIHNFPEGLTVGVGFANGNIPAGIVLAVGIGIQNIVEGLAVGLALLRDKTTAMTAFLIASFTCVVEPIGGLLGISVVSVSQPLVPYGMAFAAGAMLFVTSEEIIPETHSRGNAREATIGIIFGFIVMMMLENLFV